MAIQAALKKAAALHARVEGNHGPESTAGASKRQKEKTQALGSSGVRSLYRVVRPPCFVEIYRVDGI